MTNCITAPEVHTLYQTLTHAPCAGAHGPCLTDTCPDCTRLRELVDTRGQQCTDRGCHPEHCIYDGKAPSAMN